MSRHTKALLMTPHRRTPGFAKLMTGYARDFTGGNVPKCRSIVEPFRSRFVSSLVDLCNIDHRFTTAYHPQTNGLTERFNKTLADMLSMYVDVEQKNWDEIYHL
ncbi:transposon Ty3-I Gag-Pol polyprotein [Trichonephila clavipes]|nr:transposon Ty3-I Gag-Pol polyprotein [Trichonephila clavipes]